MTTALYRRYRSARFDELVGQEHIAATLRHEVRDNHLAHAYLFTGIRGTGKTSTARILARAVNCLESEDGEPCNRCAACVEIAGGSAVDVLEIDAASNRGIDEMRDLRDRVKYLPASLRRKVYIIDEAHMLTTDAWNAFLKTLEEPPDHVLFVLATTEPHKIPETARSRVQRFDFRRVDAAAIAAHLGRIAGLEAVDVDDAALQLLARAGQGSMRDALSLLDQTLAGGIRPVDVVAVRRALGLTDPESVEALTRALGAGDAAAALRLSSAAFAAGAESRPLLQELERLVRAAALVAVGYAEGTDLQPQERAVAAELAAAAPAAFWIDALDLLATTEAGLRQPVEARLLVEHCLLRLCQRRHASEDRLSELMKRLEQVEAVLAGGAVAPEMPAAAVPAAVAPPAAASAVEADPAPSAVPAITPAASPADVAAAPPPATPLPSVAVARLAEPPASVEQWEAAWAALVEIIDRRTKGLAAVLRDCSPMEAGVATLVISAHGKFHFEQISSAANLAMIIEAASALSGGTCAVTTRLVPRDDVSPRGRGGGGQSATARAVLDTFQGSRMTASRLRDSVIDGN